MKRKVVLLCAAVVLLLVGSVMGGLLTKVSLAEPDGLASVPPVINYQGTLLNPVTGNPVSDGQYQFVFSVYDSNTGGSMLWQELQDVTVQDGLFSVLLGYANPLEPAFFDGSPRYLGIKVGQDEEMTPRQLLVSVPYAFHAQNTNTLDGMNPDDFVAVSGDNMTGPLTVHSLRVGETEVISEQGQWVGEPTGPNYIELMRIAQLRWYDTIETSSTIPVGSSPIALAFDGSSIWVVNCGSDSVMKLRASDGSLLGTYPVGDCPRAVAFDGANIWVANACSHDNVMKLRASDGTILGTYSVGNDPYALAFDGANLWVANSESDDVMKLRASDGTILGTYPVGNGPMALAFDGTNIWVSHWHGNSVMKLKASDGSLLGTYPVGDYPYGLAFDGTNIWVANSHSGNVMKLKASDGSLLGTYSVGGGPYSLAFDGTNIWVANAYSDNVMKLSVSNGSVLGTYPVGDMPWGLAFDGFNIWVSNSGSGGNSVMKLTRAW